MQNHLYSREARPASADKANERTKTKTEIMFGFLAVSSFILRELWYNDINIDVDN